MHLEIKRKQFLRDRQTRHFLSETLLAIVANKGHQHLSIRSNNIVIVLSCPNKTVCYNNCHTVCTSPSSGKGTMVRENRPRDVQYGYAENFRFLLGRSIGEKFVKT